MTSGTPLPQGEERPTMSTFGHQSCPKHQVFCPAVGQSNLSLFDLRQGAGVRETFTVRKVSFGVGVERTFPVHSPSIEKIEVVTRGDVRRAKLYYMRDRHGKAARIREKREF